MRDNLIPYHHSKELHANCGGPCSLLLPSKMDHNDFDFCEDLITPFYHFLKQCGISTREPKETHRTKCLPEDYLIIPQAYRPEQSIPWSCSCYNTPGTTAQRLSIVKTPRTPVVE